LLHTIIVEVQHKNLLSDNIYNNTVFSNNLF
jgi:hypothetical protein